MFSSLTAEQIQADYASAKAQYKSLGVDTEKALKTLKSTPVSLHCWQGDDVKGFEVHDEAVSGGGILSTGNYPGAAQNAEMLRKDAEYALSLIPGKKRFNVHAIYAETDGRKVDRDAIRPEHFQNWMAWAKKNKLALDFNPSFFAHPLSSNGTLSCADAKIRRFWIRHGIACRKIAEAMGKFCGTTCFTNFWMPDGAKDQPVDRVAPRARMTKALDEIFAEKIDQRYDRDYLESKLFGIGVEDYTVCSNEYILGYTMAHPNVGPTMDMGHFHPTESIHDKVSAVLAFQKDLLLHVSRPIRWDSDHVVIQNDDLRNLFQEVVRGNFLNRVRISLDYFDGSINRIGAWVIGSRATQKAILAALLEPTDILRKFEREGDNAMRLALLEELKTAPAGAVWNEYCRREGVPVGVSWIDALLKYDRSVARKRG